MAIILDFAKVHEDDVHVEYVFGYPEMTRRLEITKASGSSLRQDDHHDRDHLAVLTKILRIRQAEGSWPDRGSFMA